MAASDFTHILDEEDLARLRAQFDAAALIRANVEMMARAYPPLEAWGEATAQVFYGTSPLSARDRELSLISILVLNASELSLAYHIYWALMEGVTSAEICQVMGLAGCYAGMPVMVRGLTTARTVFELLKRVAASEQRGSAHVFEELMGQLSSAR